MPSLSPVAASSLTLVPEPYDSPAAVTLTALVQQEYVARYGDPDTAPIDHRQFEPPGGRFLVGYLEGAAVAMGGVRPSGPGTVELKRMFVHPRHRGRGHSRRLLAALEEAAAELGARRIVLETGLIQPEALGLYRSSGYGDIPAYGYYAASPLSVCLAKDLPPVSG